MKTQSLKFSCAISVVINGKEVHNEKEFSRWAKNKNHFLSLIKFNMEKVLGRKLQWDMILVKDVKEVEGKENFTPGIFRPISQIHGSFIKNPR